MDDRTYYSMYDRYTPPTPKIDPVAGGKARAATARRDKWGRMQPKKYDLTPPTDHGKTGGQVRARSATRNSLGRFIKG